MATVLSLRNTRLQQSDLCRVAPRVESNNGVDPVTLRAKSIAAACASSRAAAPGLDYDPDTSAMIASKTLMLNSSKKFEDETGCDDCFTIATSCARSM